MELEVTDLIEIALQELPQIDYVESISRPGISIISAEIVPKYTADELPQIWDELRKKVRDVRALLPPGAGKPEVSDDFGDVYGFLLAVTGDGFTYAELEDYVDTIKKELSLVDGVSRVELGGQQARCIYVDVQETQLTQLGISLEQIENTLAQQNVVVDSGGFDLLIERLRIEQTGEFKSPQDIENLVLRGSTLQEMMGGANSAVPRSGSVEELVGLRTALIVGFGGLVFVIIASFLVVYLWKIDLQRMSLGALVIAMGMMVDTAIVVADGVLERLQRGMNRTQAAIEAATLPAWPLLGATFIAVMAFYPIYASDQSAGEYCRSLFQVVAISLLLSWLLSVTITPLMCIWLLPTPKQSVNEEAMYAGRMYVVFRSVLNRAIRFRYPAVGGLLALLVVSLYCFRYVDRTFFPDSARLQVMLEYWAPQGTKIQTVAADLRRIEQRLMDDRKVDSVSTFLRQGPPRFYLPVDPELAYQSYAQLIVNVHDLEGLKDVFWVAMAVTIMFGLALGSILTMILLPGLYTCFFPGATGD